MDGKNNLTRLNLNDRMKRLTKEAAVSAASEDKSKEGRDYTEEKIEQGINISKRVVVKTTSVVTRRNTHAEKKDMVSGVVTSKKTEKSVNIRNDNSPAGRFVKKKPQETEKNGKTVLNDTFRFQTKGSVVKTKDNNFRFNILDKTKDNFSIDEYKSGFDFNETEVSEEMSGVNSLHKIIEKMLGLLKKLLKIVLLNLIQLLAPLIMVVLIIWLGIFCIMRNVGSMNSDITQQLMEYLNGSISLNEIDKEYRIINGINGAVASYYDDVTLILEKKDATDTVDTDEVKPDMEYLIQSYLAVEMSVSSTFDLVSVLKDKKSLTVFIIRNIQPEYTELTEPATESESNEETETEESKNKKPTIKSIIKSLDEMSVNYGIDYKTLECNFNFLNVFKPLYKEIDEEVWSYEQYISNPNGIDREQETSESESNEEENSSGEHENFGGSFG